MDIDSDNPWKRVAWPAVLRYAGQPALAVVSSQDEWDLDPDLHSWPYQEEDRLVDSNGAEFRIVFMDIAVPGGWVVEATGKTYGVAEFQDVVEQHLAAVGTPEEWLSEYLRDFQEGQRIRAALQYIARISKSDSLDAADEEEE